MINVKQTLTNLHKKFPTLDLDQLFTILDCIVEEPQFFNYKEPDFISKIPSSPIVMYDGADSILSVPKYVQDKSNRNVSVNN